MILLKRGAEADLYLVEWYGLMSVIKRRVSKAYRVATLDLEIRRFRTVHEVQLIHSAKAAGVPTPAIYAVHPNDMEIVMSYIDGQIVKEVLDVIDEDTRLQICHKIGTLISKLHKNGIIHGDLTTSNMILTRTGEISLIDFGLGDFSGEIEDRGVDLLLAKRALYSTHISSAEKCFKALCVAYADEVGEEEALAVFKRVTEVERRGRYVPKR